MQGGLYKSGDLEVSCGAAPLAYIMEKVGGSAVLTPGTCNLIYNRFNGEFFGKYFEF